MGKRKAGFFVMCAAAVIGIVSIIMYKGAYVTSNEAYICLVAAAVVGAASAFLAPKMPKIFNWGAPVAAALAACGLAFSATVMADPIGYVISGLYSADTLTGYIYFAVVAVAAWVLYLAVGFMGIGNEE